jgi:hypothetical protein
VAELWAERLQRRRMHAPVLSGVHRAAFDAVAAELLGLEPAAFPRALLMRAMVPGSSAARPATWMALGGEEGGDAGRPAGQRRQAVPAAPGTPCAHIGAIGAARVVRLGMAGEDVRRSLCGRQRAVGLGDRAVHGASNQARTAAGAAPSGASDRLG